MMKSGFLTILKSLLNPERESCLRPFWALIDAAPRIERHHVARKPIRVPAAFVNHQSRYKKLRREKRLAHA